jgi:hypothetical protein
VPTRFHPREPLRDPAHQVVKVHPPPGGV